MDKDVLVQLVVERVSNCYDQHGLCCSESVMVVLNHVFAGGLSDKMALQMGAGFCHGLGGAGCSCGALTGSVLMLSLFLGHHHASGVSKKKFRHLIKELHDDFRREFGSSCCRVLCKKVKHDKEAHHANCWMLTKGGATLATTLLLKNRPELALDVDHVFLDSREYPV